MQIHDLNTGTPAATDVLAMDTGSDTYKTTPGNVVPDYTSGDSSTATSWTSVTAVASGLSFSTLIGRITTMMKNVRFLYGLLGTTDISGIGGGTVTGAISTLNSKLTTTLKNVQYSKAYTLGSGASLNLTADDFNVSTPSGYTAVGLAYYSSGNAYVYVRGVNALAYGTTNMMYMRNTHTQEISATAYMTVLYAKTGIV